jgi:parallel beta-helix repeat protein
MQASNVVCGQRLFVDTVLDGDVGPCPQDVGGLVVAADGITLDLNGFTIYGPPVLEFFGNVPIGVKLNSQNDVTVKNGTVRGFKSGISISGGRNNTVTGVTAMQNGLEGGINAAGIEIWDPSADNVIIGNTFVNNVVGISLVGHPNSGNLGNHIANNTVRDNVVGIGTILGGNTFLQNDVSNNRDSGIGVFESANNVLDRNTVSGNGLSNGGDGIKVFEGTTHVRIEGNIASSNGGSGIVVANGATSNSIVGNTSLNNGLSPASVGSLDLRDENLVPPCDANTWTNNTFHTSNQSCIA